MGLTSAATTELLLYAKRCDAKLELKNNTGATSWTEYSYKSLTISLKDGQPSSCNIQFAHSDFTHADEFAATNPKQLAGLVRVTIYVASESKYGFEGRVNSLEARDFGFSMTAACYRMDLNETCCEVYLEPTRVVVVDASSERAIKLIDAQHPYVYGFELGVPGTDEAFNTAGTARRSWVRLPMKMYYAAGMAAADEVAPVKFNPDFTSGAFQIQIPVPLILSEYYVSNIYAYKESTASGAANCDIARLIQLMLTYPAQKGGPGFVLGTHFGNNVTAVNAGAKTITIAGDYRKFYPDNCQIYLQENTGLTSKTLSVNGTPALSGGNTVITVDQVLTGITADGVVSRDTGIDVDRAFYYKGTCLGLLSKILALQENLKCWYHAPSQRFWIVAVEQAAAADWALIHAKSIGQPRDTRNLATRIVRTGQSGVGINDLQSAWADTPARLTDDTTAGDWFGWRNGGGTGDSTFAAQVEKLFDGDSNAGAGVHNLGAADIGDPDKYLGWYKFVKLDYGEIVNIDRIRIHMPGTMHPRAEQGHQNIFWPGLYVQISDDDATWYDLSTELYGRKKPDSVLDVAANQMQVPRGRYIRFLAGAFKNNLTTQTDPIIGFAEIEVFTNTGYEVVRQIAQIHPIVAASVGSDYFEIEGDYSAEWAVADTFTVENSTGNDGNYTVTAITVSGGNTRLGVAAVADGTADGELYTTTDYAYAVTDAPDVQRHYPDLYRRFGRLKEDRKDFGAQYTAAIAGDIALTALSESIRCFQSVQFEGVCDPRVDLYDTVDVDDELNGDIGLVFTEEVTLRFPGGRVTIGGVDYNSDVLE